MSVVRQFVKPLAWTLVVTALYAGVAVLLALAGGPTAGQAATTERIVTDRHTGIAIYGIDPVAYFTNGQALAGTAENEHEWGGATWRFANEGNRDAFARNPDVYGPRYGGHDPVAAGLGQAVAGHPSIWVVHDNRLYLFHSERNRQSFTGDPSGMLKAAERRWGQVVVGLVR